MTLDDFKALTADIPGDTELFVYLDEGMYNFPVVDIDHIEAAVYINIVGPTIP
jgi:hypothetical protein